ncbi:hypothetical protein F6X00_22935 [Vibrio vulnificus]|uniref:hypothetical protein n=1 Tax=Vibrio vulnificus TaxID=672 RepID=UPI0015FDF23D|nr:hypothetical protein [Vibrio vulnificus]MCA0763902.1 hypothetical protein [Vibrio vulnificus]MDT9655309.1 hypothetical protein [Vibrio vulnificus]QMV39221.1 hypothetical protein F6X00_22935 [Vibrio vulnificus]HAT8541523.1 hypothetical protein [Vibrio vulnificus]HDY7614006.1 hypothetical protein [Vibrio vulnificus]
MNKESKRVELNEMRTVATKLFNENHSAWASPTASEKDLIFYLLCKKFLNHINSLHFVLQGTDFNDIIPGTEQLDHPTAKVILRAAFETYLTIAHHYWNEAVSHDLRILIYKHSGVSERLALPVNDGESDIIRRKRHDHALKRDKLEQDIRQLGQELGISNKHLNQSLKTGWRAGNSWTKIGCNSSLADHYVQSVYPYLCGYSHSGYESCIQLGEDEGLCFEEKIQNQEILFVFSSYLIAKFCESFYSYSASKGCSSEVDMNSVVTLVSFYDRAFASRA